ncbi:hypothetical protein BDM02DRAFT_3098000, partial [Thelephora ganbajun]
KSLYSDVSGKKRSNPTSYRSTVHWWREILQTVVLKHWFPRSSDTSVPHVLLTLADSFRREGAGKQLCLATVISELQEERIYIPLNRFMTVTRSIHDAGWLPYRIASHVIGKPLWWALQQTGVVESGCVIESSGKGDYVLRGLIESAAQGVSAHHRAKETGVFGDKLHTAEFFKREFSGVAPPDIVLSDLDVKVLLKHLERDVKVVVNGRVVIQSHLQPSHTNLDFHRLPSLLARVPSKSSRYKTGSKSGMDALTTRKACSTLKRNRREIALGHLRARKRLEDILVKRSEVLECLESTLWTVEHAAGDVEIMKLYESSAVTLRTVFSHPYLQRDKIDETMEALHSATEGAKDADLAIRLASEAEWAMMVRLKASCTRW